METNEGAALATQRVCQLLFLLSQVFMNKSRKYTNWLEREIVQCIWKDPIHSTYHHLQSINSNISHIAIIIESVVATSQQAKIGKDQTWP